MRRIDKEDAAGDTSLKTGHQRLWFVWFGQGLSGIGSQTTTIAFPLIAALTLDAGPAEMSLLVAASKLPNIFVGVFAALLIDRIGPRRVLFLTEYGRAAAMLSVPLLAWLGWLSIPYLATISFIAGSLTAAYELSYFVIVPMLVSEERLIRVNGLMEGTHSASQIAGIPLGGLLVQAIGATRTLFVDAVSFLFSALTIHSIRLIKERPPDRTGAGVKSFFHEIGAGMQSVWKDKRLRLLGLSNGGFNLFLGIGISVEVLYVFDVTDMSPGEFGLAVGIGLIGGLLGSIFAERIINRLGVRVVFAGGLFLASSGPIFVYAAGDAEGMAPLLVGAGQFANSAGEAISIVTSLSLRQKIVPQKLRAQVFASMRVLSRGGTPLGAMAGAVATSFISLGGALVIAALGQATIALVSWSFRRVLPR
ncbi:MFS transporter [Streptomyces sp. NPDC054866]